MTNSYRPSFASQICGARQGGERVSSKREIRKELIRMGEEEKRFGLPTMEEKVNAGLILDHRTR